MHKLQLEKKKKQKKQKCEVQERFYRNIIGEYI